MQAIIKKLNVFLSAALCLGVVLTGSARAQSGGEETETATESQLLRIVLPAGAQRVFPRSVPAEIAQTLQKITASGGDKFRQGESEVLLWADAKYKKANASAIVNRLNGVMKTAGWKYSVEGEENGVTVFTAVKESPRRVVVGFYAATDEALVLAAAEVLANTDAATAGNGEQIEADASTEQIQKPAANQNSGGSIVGVWGKGMMSTMGDMNTVTGAVKASNGGTFKYVFHPNGSFEFVGYMDSTVYGCTTTLFQDKRGKYTIKGNQITLTLSKNFWRNQYSCSPASNKERDYTLTPETYTFRVQQNDGERAQICLANQKGETCYSRQEN
jgi:hypothetical protein